MGLLDAYFSGQPLSSDPDKASAADGALWSLAAGLIGGRGAAGPIIGNAVQGAMGTYQGLLGDALKRQYVQSQIAENASQAEMRKAQMAQAQWQQTMQEDLLRSLGIGPSPGGGAAPLAAPAAPQVGGGVPGALPPQAGADRFLGVPNAAAGADIAFNKGQGLGGMIAKGAEPNISWQSGVAIDNKTGRRAKGFPIIPQVERNGMGYALVPDDETNTFSVVAPAGATETFGRYKDIENRSQAGMETQEITLPNGRTVRMTKAQIADLTNRAGGDTPAAGQNAPGSTIAPSVASAPQQPMPPQLEQMYRAAVQEMSSPDGNTKLRAISTVQNIETAAKRMGYSLPADAIPTPQVPRGQQTPRGPAMPGVEVQSPAAAEGAKTTAKGQAEHYVALQQQFSQRAMTIPSQLTRLDRIERLLQDVDGGKLAPVGKELASAAASLGFKIDPSLANKEAAEALTIEMAAEMRVPGTGVDTDKDMQQRLARVPDLSKTAAGRSEVTRSMRGVLQRQMYESQLAQKYIEKYGRLDNDFERQLGQWRAANPIRF